MPLFGPPNIEKMKEKGDIKGLIKALQHKNGPTTYQAAKALGELYGHKDAAQAIGATWNGRKLGSLGAAG